MQSLSDVVKQVEGDGSQERFQAGPLCKEEKERQEAVRPRRRRKKRSKDLDHQLEWQQVPAQVARAAPAVHPEVQMPPSDGDTRQSRGQWITTKFMLWTCSASRRREKLFGFTPPSIQELYPDISSLRCFARLSKGRVDQDFAASRSISGCHGQTQHAGLTEIRDIREVSDPWPKPMDFHQPKREIARADGTSLLKGSLQCSRRRGKGVHGTRRRRSKLISVRQTAWPAAQCWL